MMLASYLDSTNLKADATQTDIRDLCAEARQYLMAAVCVLPYRINLAKSLLQGSTVKTATVIGFPLGNDPVAVKVFAAGQALQNGADELDMVINLGALKDGDYQLLAQEISAVMRLQEQKGFILKVIVETALLSQAELIDLVKLVGASGAQYIKTSTGMASRGVSLADIDIINRYKEPQLLIKASGGIRTLDFAQALVERGVSRLGTSCAGQILGITGA